MRSKEKIEKDISSLGKVEGVQGIDRVENLTVNNLCDIKCNLGLLVEVIVDIRDELKKSKGSKG